MSQYCTYLTIYSGNKLPPFYVGYSTRKKIQNGYHGTVASKSYKILWKEELKKNPELFKTIIISSHNSAKEANEREIEFQKTLSVIKNPLYINKAIGLYCDPTTREHGPMFGKTHSAESRAKISFAGLNRKRVKKVKIVVPKKPHGNIGNNYGKKNKGNLRPDLSEYNKLRSYNVEK